VIVQFSDPVDQWVFLTITAFLFTGLIKEVCKLITTKATAVG